LPDYCADAVIDRFSPHTLLISLLLIIATLITRRYAMPHAATRADAAMLLCRHCYALLLMISCHSPRLSLHCCLPVIVHDTLRA